MAATAITAATAATAATAITAITAVLAVRSRHGCRGRHGHTTAVRFDSRDEVTMSRMKRGFCTIAWTVVDAFGT